MMSECFLLHTCNQTHPLASIGIFLEISYTCICPAVEQQPMTGQCRHKPATRIIQKTKPPPWGPITQAKFIRENDFPENKNARTFTGFGQHSNAVKN
jgi:hypothetical protein